jgi:hypothetical protein
VSAVHTAAHEELLAALLAGELGRDDPAVEAVLAACEHCSERLAELESTAERLTAAAEEERSILAEASRPRRSPGTERLEARLRELALVEAHARPRRRTLFWLVAAGIAGSLFAWTLLSDGGRGAEPPVILGESLRLLRPVGTVKSFDVPFVWEYEGPAPGGFRVLIYEDGEDGRLLHEEPRWMEKTWTPEPSLVAGWPARIRWEIEPLDAFGDPVASQSESASRSSP